MTADVPEWPVPWPRPVDTAYVRSHIDPHGGIDDLEEPLIRSLCDEVDDLREHVVALQKAATELLDRPCQCSLRDRGCGYVQRLRWVLEEWATAARAATRPG